MPLSIAADIAAGQEKSATCQGCHGADGNSYGPEWPHLAGQHSSYIIKQVKNFQSGSRTDPTMSAMVVGLVPKDIEDIAAYFSSKSITAEAEKNDAAIVLTGRNMYKGGSSYKGIPACAGCHGPNGVGNSPAVFPSVAGQRVDYLIKTLKDFRSGARSNDPNSIMRNIAVKMSDNDIKAVATYITQMSR